jgi:hypothetical protein
MNAKLIQSAITRRSLIAGSGAFAASSFLACRTLLGEELVEQYDGRCEAPCPPEAIASLIDPLTKGEGGNVTLALVRHRHPSTMPSGKRATWVCMLDGKPLWVIASPPRVPENESSGISAAALKRARVFLAENEELRGKEKPADWKPKKETLLPAYQSKRYGLQITEMKLIDRETESWEVTAEPIEDGQGGEVWMRFSKGGSVSAEYGR